MSRRSFVAASLVAAPFIYEAPKLIKLGEPSAEGFGISGPVDQTPTPTVERETDLTPTPTLVAGVDQTPTPTGSDTPKDPAEPDDVVHVGGEVVRVLPKTGVGNDR